MVDLNGAISDLTSGHDWKPVLDTLTMFANKPVNFQALQDLRQDFFLVAIKDFLKQRHKISSLEIENIIAKVKDRFEQDAIDLYTFQGIKVPVTLANDSGEAAIYYACEEYFQFTLYDICQGKIRSSVMEAIRSLSPFGKKVLKVYVEECLPYVPNKHRIHIDGKKFQELSQNSFYQEEIEGLHYDTIKDTIVKSGLGYRYEPNYICPFWYTIKDDLGRKFRTMISDAIK